MVNKVNHFKQSNIFHMVKFHEIPMGFEWFTMNGLFPLVQLVPPGWCQWCCFEGALGRVAVLKVQRRIPKKWVLLIPVGLAHISHISIYIYNLYIIIYIYTCKYTHNKTMNIYIYRYIRITVISWTFMDMKLIHLTFLFFFVVLTEGLVLFHKPRSED